MRFFFSELGIWVEIQKYYFFLTKSTNNSTFYFAFYTTKTKAYSGKSKANKANTIYTTIAFIKLHYFLGVTGTNRIYEPHRSLGAWFTLISFQGATLISSGFSLAISRIRAHGDLHPPRKIQNFPQRNRFFLEYVVSIIVLLIYRTPNQRLGYSLFAGGGCHSSFSPWRTAILIFCL